jgi:hypothetical protein
VDGGRITAQNASGREGFYDFLENFQEKLPESRIFPRDEVCKSLKQNSYHNGTEIAIKSPPVIYRLLRSSGQPKAE